MDNLIESLERDKQMIFGLRLNRIAEDIDKAIELLKEQKELVRCKDCKFWYKDECCHLCKITGDLHPANWFCADGERRTD